MEGLKENERNVESWRKGDSECSGGNVGNLSLAVNVENRK